MGFAPLMLGRRWLYHSRQSTTINLFCCREGIAILYSTETSYHMTALATVISTRGDDGISYNRNTTVLRSPYHYPECCRHIEASAAQRFTPSKRSTTPCVNLTPRNFQFLIGHHLDVSKTPSRAKHGEQNIPPLTSSTVLV